MFQKKIKWVLEGKFTHFTTLVQLDHGTFVPVEKGVFVVEEEKTKI